MRFLIILLLFLNSCSTTSLINYEEIKAAIFQQENNIIVRFNDNPPYIIRVINKCGEQVGVFLVTKDNSIIDLNYEAGVYIIYLYNKNNNIISSKKITLR